MNRVLKMAKRNIRRAPYQALAATMVMFTTFLALTLFALLAMGLELSLKHYESKPQVIAFFDDNVKDSDVKAIQTNLEETGKVSQLKYVSKEEALKIYQERNKNDPTLLELVTASILPASLEISANSLNDLGPIAQILKKEPVVSDVLYPEDIISTLSQATAVVRIIGIVIVAYLIIFSLLIILMVTGFKIRLKRSEIEIMRLLGASNWFIRGPYILEGITYGVFGAVGAWVFSYISLWYFTPFLQSALGELKLLPPSPILMLVVLAGLILAAVLIGGVGSYGAIRRYLKL